MCVCVSVSACVTVSVCVCVGGCRLCVVGIMMSPSKFNNVYCSYTMS